VKTLTSIIIALIVALQAIALPAQTPEKIEPWFTLTISEYRHDNFGPGIHRVEVALTNTSKEAHHWEGCAVLKGYYSASVTYNGVPLVEQEQANEKHQNQEKMRHAGCTSSFAEDNVRPGDARGDIFVFAGPHGYDMSKPGTYEVTVSRETAPDDPARSVTVKSNTITIVVPEPEADASK